MNALQNVELNILKHFIEICDKMNLTYYLVCGSALGAAKYKGFIPWDDDIDVGMPRKDYEIFCKEAQNCLIDWLFLQTSISDRNYPNIYAKLRDIRTTYIEKTDCDIVMNHGIYIDIFPLDGYPKRELLQKWVEHKKSLFIKKELCVFRMNLSKKQKTAAKIEKILGYDKKPSRHANKLTKSISRFSIEESKYICNHGNWQGKLEYAPKEQYGKGTWATFEGLKVRIPEMYDEYLTQKYGDWRADLPVEQQVGHHYAEVIDLTRPYTDYIIKLKNGKIRLKTSAELLKDGITPPENYQY